MRNYILYQIWIIFYICNYNILIIIFIAIKKRQTCEQTKSHLFYYKMTVFVILPAQLFEYKYLPHVDKYIIWDATSNKKYYNLL